MYKIFAILLMDTVILMVANTLLDNLLGSNILYIYLD